MRSFLNANNEMGRCEYMGNGVWLSTYRSPYDVAGVYPKEKKAGSAGEQGSIVKAARGLILEEWDNEMLSIHEEKV